MTIDYIDIINAPKMTENEKWELKKISKDIQALAKKYKTKFLVVDSESVSRGRISFKEI